MCKTKMFKNIYYINVIICQTNIQKIKNFYVNVDNVSIIVYNICNLDD